VTTPLELFARSEWGIVFAAIWGALWGSFFNVVIVRLPAGESLVRPPSHCRNCGERVRWYDNLPVISYLLLRGRCRFCGAGYSLRYPLVELLVAVLAVLMHRHFVLQAAAEGPLSLAIARFFITSLFCGLLVAISFIDLDTMRIPNVITYPGIPLSMALSVFMGHPRLWDGAIGGVAGYLVIRLIADGYELITGRQGMGYGDAKLLAMIGGLLGWQALFPTILLGSLQGSVIGIGVLIAARLRGGAAAPDQENEPDRETTKQTGDEQPEIDENPTLMRTAIPFGPFLCLAGIEVILLSDIYRSLFPFLS
jgi:leader peptidase (prepilin peptidase)/N-methyltransferase